MKILKKVTVVKAARTNKHKTPARKAAKTQKQVVYASQKSLRGTGIDRQYLAALVDPFSPAAMGAQVPDEYPFPTGTYHLHSTNTVNIPAGGSVFDGVVLPSPTLTYVDLKTTSATQGFWSANPVEVGNTIVGIGALTTDAALAALATSLRVVGFGIRVKNNLNFSTIQGRVIVAPVILPNAAFKQLSQNTVNANLTVNAIEMLALQQSIFARLVGSGGIGSQILELPGAMEFMLDQLIDKEFMFTTRPISPYGKDFRLCRTTMLGDNGAGTLAGAEDAWEDSNVISRGIASNTVIADSFPSSVSDCGGLVGFVIHAEGLPGNSTPFDVEVIMHLEIQPRAAANAPTPSNNHAAHGPMAFIDTIAAVAQSPFGQMVLPAVARGATSLMASFARQTR